MLSSRFFAEVRRPSVSVGVLAASGDLVNRATLANLVGTSATVSSRDRAAKNFNQRFHRAVARRE